MVSLKTNIAAEKQIREKSFFLPYSITDFLKNCNKKLNRKHFYLYIQEQKNRISFDHRKATHLIP